MKNVASSKLIPSIFVAWRCGCSIAIIVENIPTSAATNYQMIEHDIYSARKAKRVLSNVVIFKLLFLNNRGYRIFKFVLLTYQI